MLERPQQQSNAKEKKRVKTFDQCCSNNTVHIISDRASIQDIALPVSHDLHAQASDNTYAYMHHAGNTEYVRSPDLSTP